MHTMSQNMQCDLIVIDDITKLEIHNFSSIYIPCAVPGREEKVTGTDLPMVPLRMLHTATLVTFSSTVYIDVSRVMLAWSLSPIATLALLLVLSALLAMKSAGSDIRI